MPFRPNPHDTITITGATYTFTEHPAAPGMVYGQAGRRGTVYQLTDGSGHLWALKVFLPQYAEPRLVGQAERLRGYAGLPGLKAAAREVLTGSRQLELLRDYPGLAYAVLMPWVAGKTWLETVLGGEALLPEQSLALAKTMAMVMVGLEERGLAHCDLSGPNVILTSKGGIELVDLEEMYGPELLKPEQLPGGSPGYAHRTAPHGLWHSKADRFAGAVLLGEILGLADEQVVGAKWGEGYFDPAEMGENSERYRLLKAAVVGWYGARSGELLGEAWFADTLAGCPTFTHWLAALPGQPQEKETRTHVVDGRAIQNTTDVDDPGVLALQAEALLREGKARPAMVLLQQAEALASGAMKAMIRERIGGLAGSPAMHRGSSEQESGSSAEMDPDPKSWTCPVCGQEVSAAEAVCPHCEQGERQVVIQETGVPVSTAEADEKAGHAVAGSADPGGTEKKGTSSKAGAGMPGWAWLLLALALGGGLLGGGRLIGDSMERRAAETAVAQASAAAAVSTEYASQTETARPTATTTMTITPTKTPSVSLTPTEALEPGAIRERDMDGMVEVFVPAGSFLMGSTSADTDADDDEFPQHEVYLDAYWIDRTEVTHDMYMLCVEAGACAERNSYDESDRPARFVTWYDAAGYCEWAGGRLPSEAEWEKAARGEDGRLYPWGDAAPTCQLAQYSGCDGSTIPVGSLPAGASPYGVLEMAGNVWEWVADWYDADYYNVSPDENPTGPETGEYRVLRGGWWFLIPSYLRAATRFGVSPDFMDDCSGFRCVRSP